LEICLFKTNKTTNIMNKTILHLIIISSCLINLKVNAQCTITVASDKDSLCEGLNHTITATNIPSGASIVWQKDGNDVLGNTTNTLTTNSIGNYNAISTVSAPNNWVQLNPFPQGNNLVKIKFTDSLTGWISSVGKNFLKTIDGGKTWVNKSINIPNITSYSSLCMVNSLKGWVTIGQDFYSPRYVYFTNDGGETWSPLNRSNYNYDYASEIYFFNENFGIIICSNGMFKTNDKGVTWTPMTITATYQIFSSFHFINESIGWAVSYSQTYNNQIYKTIDGGITWTLQYTGPSNWYNNLRNIQFSDMNNGWCTESNLILRTTDGGTTWTRHNIPLDAWYDYSISDYHFFDSQNGILVNYDKTFKTINGGQTWNLLGGVKTYVNDIAFVNNSIVYGVGANGIIVKTTNGGNTWFAQSKSVTNESLKATFFLDCQQGWVAGLNNMILKTINGGRNWVRQYNTATAFLNANDIFFINSQKGWVAGAGGIYRTISGGTTWLPPTTINTNGNILNTVFFRDSLTGWIGGQNGLIMKSLNGGVSWIAKPSGTSATIQKIFFIDDLIGWAVGSSGKILKTTDGGETWVSLPSAYSAQTFNGVQFLDNQIGFVVGTDGVFLKTINGGSNWTPYNTGGDPTIPYYFNDVHFIDTQKGWIVGPDIRKTVNGGLTWTMDGTNMALNKTLRACHFIDENNGFVVGNDGTIVKYSNTLSCSSNTLSINSKPTSPVITATISEIESGTSSVLSSTGCINGVFNWSSGQVGSPITVNPAITTNYTAKCFLNGCLSNSSNNLAISVYNSVYSIKSGNWDDPLTWSSNRVPTITDNITVRSNHTISLNIENALCRKLFLNTNANLTYESSKGLTVTK
jgi:photosystem II stability/assembly factor-like uncharacterized protein